MQQLASKRPRHRAAIGSAVLALCAILLPAPGRAADPFYEQLYEKGRRALATGDSEEAAEDLRLACFGLLDEPGPLTACLVHLALAQAAEGDDEAFRETYGRILDVEQRFETYGGSRLEPGIRRDFEAAIETRIPYELLDDVPAFRPVAYRLLEAQITTLPIGERRDEIEALLALDPDNLVWKSLMAEVEMEEGNYQKAVEIADEVLSRDTELLKAICVRGLARAALESCQEALGDLVSCDRDAEVRKVTVARLGCHIALGEWDAAEALLDQLSRTERGSAEIRDLARQVRQGRRDAEGAGGEE